MSKPAEWGFEMGQRVAHNDKPTISGLCLTPIYGNLGIVYHCVYQVYHIIVI